MTEHLHILDNSFILARAHLKFYHILEASFWISLISEYVFLWSFIEYILIILF